MPKSMTRGPAAVRMMFEGLRSLCTSAFACAFDSARSRPDATVLSGSGPWRSTTSLSERPRHVLGGHPRHVDTGSGVDHRDERNAHPPGRGHLTREALPEVPVVGESGARGLHRRHPPVGGSAQADPAHPARAEHPDEAERPDAPRVVLRQRLHHPLGTPDVARSIAYDAGRPLRRRPGAVGRRARFTTPDAPARGPARRCVVPDDVATGRAFHVAGPGQERHSESVGRSTSRRLVCCSTESCCCGSSRY